MNKRLQHGCLPMSVIVTLTVTVGCSSLLAQEVSPHAGKKTEAVPPEASDCRRCHTCAKPTLDEVCLPTCTRVQAAADALAKRHGPDVVILDELQADYLPVPFDHKGHADMAEMTHGCVICHHYTPEGQQHPACKTCHEIATKGTGIHKPGLKGAYHRQCLNCHKDWTDASDCSVCHRRRTSGPRSRDAAAPATTTDDILHRMHPPIEQPRTEFYRAESKAGTKSTVIFRHWEHQANFDLKCVDCHHEENCTRCHRKDNGERPPRSITEHHRACLRCHKADMDEATTEITGRCKRCHWQEGQPMPKPFDHADTGWPLSEYHQGSSCRDCHRNVPFVKLNKDCNSCHGGWEPESFDHAVTGQWLDTNHREIDCGDCHIGRKFDVTPKCDECHDEDEGFVFPKKRPGPVMRTKVAKPK